MSDLDDWSGAGQNPLDELESKLGPLTPDDVAQLESWMADQPYRLAKRNLDGLPPEDREVVLKEASKQAARLHLTSPEGEELLGTVRGLSIMLLLMMRHKDPGAKPKDVEKYLSLKDLQSSGPDSLWGRMAKVNGLAAPEGESGN